MEKIKIFTSYYSNINKIRENYPDFVLISISGGLENNIITLIDDWDKRLAPKKDFFLEYKNSKEGLPREIKYVKEFNDKVLYKDKIKIIINSWLEKYPNKTIVMLCYEHPKDFCHRQIVAKEIETVFNVDVKELFFENYERIDYKMFPKGLDEDEW